MDALTVLTIFCSTICLFIVLRGGLRPRNWNASAVVGLTTGAFGYLSHSTWAQVICCMVTAIFLLVPGILIGRVRKRLQLGQFRRAYELSLKIPVPTKKWGPHWGLWPLLAEFYEGNPIPAEEKMTQLAASDAPEDIMIYEILLTHLRPFKEIQLLRDPLLHAHLCLEHGRVDEGIELFARLSPKKISWMGIKAFRQNIIPPLCFAGLVDEAKCLIGQTRQPPGIGDVWVATALAANGQKERAVEELENILRQPDPTGMAHHTARIRLENLPTPPTLDLSATDALRFFQREARAAFILRPGHIRKFPSLALSVLGLIGFFGYQWWSGGLDDGEVIWQLGALYPNGQFPREPWRLLNYGLLHGGLVHLLTNLFSLVIIGPFVLRALGATGFWFVFIGGIILAGLGISYFGQTHLTVGASGGVMALMAALIPICLWHPMVKGSRSARGFLNLIVMLCVIQAAVDSSNAVISFSGHLSGLIAGSVLGSIALLLGVVSSENLDEVREFRS